MAIILEAAYSKKLRLPNFSSHSFVLSIRTELSDLAQAQAESARLYALLQQSVDQQIQEVGFLPDGTAYGMNGNRSNAENRTVNNANGHANPQQNPQPPAHQETAAAVVDDDDEVWRASDKQKEFILKLIEQHHLDKNEIEALAKEMFALPLKTLNRLQASGLIDEMLERYGKTNGKNNGNGNGGHRRSTGTGNGSFYRRNNARA